MAQHRPLTTQSSVDCSCGYRSRDIEGWAAHALRRNNIDTANFVIQLLGVLGGLIVGFFVAFTLLIDSDVVIVALLAGSSLAGWLLARLSISRSERRP